MKAVLKSNANLFLMISLGLVVLQATLSHIASAQLSITAMTPSFGSGTGVPNTFIGAMGSQIAGSLLGIGTPALLWAVVPSNSVNEACNLIVNTGTQTVTATVSDEWGGTSEDLNLQLVATGGCLAASDGSGTEFVFTDNFGRQSAIVCPNNAGSVGCGVFVTGDDINAVYSAGGTNNKRKLLSFPDDHGLGAIMMGRRRRGRNMLQCSGRGAAIGGLIGLGTGAITALGCGFLSVFAPFCVAGVLGIEIIGGAVGGSGCIQASGCFPGDTLVRSIDGNVKAMFQLELGDKVAVFSHSNKAIIYDDVYAFGHKDADAIATFLRITMEPATGVQLLYGPNTGASYNASTSTTRSLHITDLHFVPSSGADIDGQVFFKRARDIKMGDVLWGVEYRSSHPATDQLATPYRVTGISSTVRIGLYNPLTLGGTILVDGVLASAHSDWFLDPAFDALGLPLSWLHHLYQFILTPVRVLYSVLGKEVYVTAYNWLDRHIDLATFGTNHGGTVTCFLLSSFTLAIYGILAIKSPAAWPNRAKTKRS